MNFQLDETERRCRDELRAWLGAGAARGELSQRLRALAADVLGPDVLLSPEDPHAPWEGRWQRTWLSSRADTILGGTSEVQRNVIARRLLGLPRSS